MRDAAPVTDVRVNPALLPWARNLVGLETA